MCQSPSTLEQIAMFGTAFPQSDCLWTDGYGGL